MGQGVHTGPLLSLHFCSAPLGLVDWLQSPTALPSSLHCTVWGSIWGLFGKKDAPGDPLPCSRSYVNGKPLFFPPCIRVRIRRAEAAGEAASLLLPLASKLPGRSSGDLFVAVSGQEYPGALRIPLRRVLYTYLSPLRGATL